MPRRCCPVELALPKDFDHEQPYERDRKRMAMVTQRDKVSQHIYDDDRQRLERLIGFNSKNEKEPTLEKLDYEARMRKYKPMEFFTPYGKEWHRLHKPDRGVWRAPTPLDEITSRSAVIPDETKLRRHDAAKKRQSLRQLAAQKSKQFSAASKLYIEDAKYKAGVLRATLSTPKRDDGPRGRGAIRLRSPAKAPPGADGAARRRSRTSAKTPQFKKSFFKLPGSNKTPVKDEDKPKTGARTTVAKRLFMKKTIVKPRREGAAVVGIDDGSDFAAGSMATLLPDESCWHSSLGSHGSLGSKKKT
ncbi:hypothetical protein JL720_12895 [Aureococcus anophagefferens]|nr:hypothetical protein JL720_12895 [Aureococcus anophagefferens]